MTDERPRNKSNERIARRKEVRAARLEAARRRRGFPIWIVALIAVIVIAAGAALFAVSNGLIALPVPSGSLPSIVPDSIAVWNVSGPIAWRVPGPSPGGVVWRASWL